MVELRAPKGNRSWSQNSTLIAGILAMLIADQCPNGECAANSYKDLSGYVHPLIDPAIKSGGGPKRFCQAHPSVLRFVNNAGAGKIKSLIRAEIVPQCPSSGPALSEHYEDPIIMWEEQTGVEPQGAMHFMRGFLGPDAHVESAIL